MAFLVQLKLWLMHSSNMCGDNLHFIIHCIGQFSRIFTLPIPLLFDDSIFSVSFPLEKRHEKAS